MSNFRDIKRQARLLVHDTMKLPAVYVSSRSDPLAPFRLVHMRLTSKNAAIGGLKGTSFHTVEREEVLPSAIVLVSEVPSPVRNEVLSLTLGEAYQIDYVEPKDDITVKVNLLALDKADCNRLPIPAVWIPVVGTAIPVIVRVDYSAALVKMKFENGVSPAVGDLISLSNDVSFRVDQTGPQYCSVSRNNYQGPLTP